MRAPDQVTAGSVFVALGRHGRHEAVARALRAGARFVLVDDAKLAAAAGSGRRVRVVPDARRAYALLSAAAQGMPGHRLTAVGVTGTNGKTTVAAMLHWVLNEAGLRCGLVGTVAVDTGRRRLPAGLTTPDAADLNADLAEMREAGLTHVVMEASSHGLDQRRTDGIRFQVAVFTNFGVDHLDYHSSAEAYFAAKRRLFEMLRPEAWAVLNADDARWRPLAASTRARVATFGCGPSADVRAEAAGGPAIRVTAGGFRAEGELPGLGAHRVDNALAAFTAARVLGVAPDTAWDALLRFPGMWRRLQIVDPAPEWVVDDCAHNPGNIRAAIAAVCELHPRTLWVVHAVRGNRGAAINQANAAALVEALRPLGHRLAVTTADDLAGPNDRVTPQEEEAYRETLHRLGQAYDFLPRADAALTRVREGRKPGDGVLILGAHAMDTAAALWRRLTVAHPSIV